MGNQLSTEVKAESDGIEGGLESSPPPRYPYPPLHSEQFLPSSPNQPDIVFSSQITSTPRPRPPSRPPSPSPSTPFVSRFERPVDPIPNETYLRIHRDMVKSASNGEITHSSPLTPTFMPSPPRNFKQEIPESPDYNYQMSTPTRRSGKAKKRRSRNRSSLNSHAHMSNINGSHNNDVDMNGTVPADDGLPLREYQSRQEGEDGRRKERSLLASPDMGNTKFAIKSVEADGAQEDSLPSWRPTNGTPAESTPPNPLSSKKRKTGDSGSRSRKRRRQKNMRNRNNAAGNTTSFSGLAESLYAGRKNPGPSTSSVNGSMDNAAQNESPVESDEESASHDSSSSSNTNNTNGDSEQAANAGTASDDEMDVDPSESDPSDKVESDNQDQMVSDGDEQSDEPKHSEESNDDEQNDGVGGNATNGKYHLDKDKEVAESPEHDHNSIAGPRPKQGSARKRFVKQTFFERLSEVSANGTKEHASSSPVAGPSKVAAKKQAKISTMLKSQADSSPEPQASSSKRRSGPKAKNPHPHQLVTGQFSEFELRNITQAVERWRDDHHLTQAQVNDLIQGNPKEVRSHEFWSHIVATCPNRGRQKVINQCRRKFHNFVARGTWTPEQQEELKNMWEMHGNKFSVIGKLINRHPEDVRDRIRNYVVCGENRRVQPWTLEEEEKLKSIITEALEAIREQRQKTGKQPQEPEEDLIDWQLVSERMDRTRSRLQCIQKWKLMHRKQANRGSIDGGEVLPVDQIIQNARDEATAMSSRDLYNVVKAIRACNANAESRIPWAKVRSKQLGDQWSRPTLMVAWYRLKRSVPDWNIMSIPEIIRRLSKKYHETQELEFPGDDDYDFDAEYAEIEQKINKILKPNRRTPKTPDTVVKTDDEEEEDEGEEGDEDIEDEDEDEENDKGDESEENDESGEENEEKVAPDENNKEEHQEENDNDDDSSSDQPDDEDGSIEDGIDEEPGGSIDLSNNADNEDVRRESSVDASSISDFKPKKTPRMKRFKSSTRATKSRNMTPSKRGSIREVIDESSEEEAEGAEEDPSSDTNASEVESIPARL
ncbi:hypothetical protein F4776DRAFT_645313 [Hypoxylon sp. NC0597]|nr:hypothetical protein F4776DRAFT_645313 [Hypoxylon sp. NC0597]